jgi:hypothetical protein
VSGDIVRPPHGSASCACLFCWHDITTLTAELAAERAEFSAVLGDAIAKDAEIERLTEVVANYENAITWDTTCTNCARLMDGNYDQYCEVERLRAAGDALAEWLLRIVPDEDRDLNDALTEWEARRER